MTFSRYVIFPLFLLLLPASFAFVLSTLFLTLRMLRVHRELCENWQKCYIYQKPIQFFCRSFVDFRYTIQSERDQKHQNANGKNSRLLLFLLLFFISPRINSRSTNTLTCHGIERDPHL